MIVRALLAALMLAAPAVAQTSPEKSPGTLVVSPELDGAEIVRRSHMAAGGSG